LIIAQGATVIETEVLLLVEDRTLMAGSRDETAFGYLRPDGTWLWRSDPTLGEDWRIVLSDSEVSP
jgi:hypothetical protein